MTHDYKRNGTTDLFAAMNVPPARCSTTPQVAQLQRRVGVLQTDRPARRHGPRHPRRPGQPLRPQGSAVAEWLAHPKRARWHLHFTPTSSSWLNLVEGWFSLLTKKRLQRGIFNSIDELTEAIETWTEHWNDDPIHSSDQDRRSHPEQATPGQSSSTCFS